MPRTPQDPNDLGAHISEINRRLKALETTSGLRNASMSDPDGMNRVLLGRLAEDVYGIEVSDQDGNVVFLVSGEGMSAPYIPVTVSDRAASESITSASWAATRWQLQAETMSHPGLYMWLAVHADAGTTGEVRITCPALGTQTDPFTLVGTGATVLQQFRWLHGAAINIGPVQFEVEARRTAGSGTFAVFEPSSAALTAGHLCTPGGLP